MAKSIEVIVQPTGEVKIDAVGFKGADCEKATAFLEKALGQTTSKQKKPEYHRRAENVQKIGG
jgi:hypothetical protein